ncbi:MAG: hypothetical protein LC713_04640, partial [Actinobacteria bacterium]|nr:hypothetical protein [Actinomycetota bacterium]
QEATAIPEERIAFRVTRGALVDVHLNPSSSAGEDVARQMITTMSTLVVAIASFYFGTSSVQQAFSTTQAAGGGGSSTTSLALMEPQNTPRSLRRKDGGGWEHEPIRVRSVPLDAHVAGSVEGDVASSLAAVDDSGAYTYTPVEPAAAGVKVTFLVSGHKDVAPVTITYLVPGDAGGGSAAVPPEAVEPASAPPQPVVEQPVVEQPVVEQPVVELPVEPQPGEPQPEEPQPEEPQPDPGVGGGEPRP